MLENMESWKKVIINREDDTSVADFNLVSDYSVPDAPDDNTAVNTAV